MVVCAMMAALGLTLPVAFHAVGLGSQFLPMLLPLLLCGFLAPFRFAAATGFAVPWISALATGMPPLYPPVAAVVAVEGAVLAGVASLLYRPGRSVWVALIPAVVAGRLTTFLATWALAGTFHLPAGLSAAAQTLQGVPGVALQLVVVPVLVKVLADRRGPLFAS